MGRLAMQVRESARHIEIGPLTGDPDWLDRIRATPMHGCLSVARADFTGSIDPAPSQAVSGSFD